MSPIATASAPSTFSFLRTISKMSGAGFTSSTSSEEVFRSTKSAMRAMSRYLSTSSFLAEEATAIRSPASRTRRNRSGTAEKGRTSGKYSVLKRLPRHSSISLPWSRCSSGDRKTGMSLSRHAALYRQADPPALHRTGMALQRECPKPICSAAWRPIQPLDVARHPASSGGRCRLSAVTRVRSVNGPPDSGQPR